MAGKTWGFSSIAEAQGARKLDFSKHPELQTLQMGRGWGGQYFFFLFLFFCISDSQEAVLVMP